MVLTNKCMAFLTAAVPINSKHKYIMNLCLLPLELEMTEGGGFAQRRSINVITARAEMEADGTCGEFCAALNYISTVFFSPPLPS